MKVSTNYQILSISADSKTVKGEKLGYLTGILYLAPHTIAFDEIGKNGTLCPFSKIAGCDKACLYTAGRGAFNSVQKARIDKTISFIQDKEFFMIKLFHSVRKLVNQANKKGLLPAVRLNGTSDIQWHTIKFKSPQTGINGSIMEHFPDVQFYDYTKNIKSDYVNIPKNYYVVFSYSEYSSDYAKKALEKAINNNSGLSVVFRNSLPQTFKGLPVIDADDTDLRFLDKKVNNINGAYIVGLKAKGKARKDYSGFVV